jgi:UDP-N-acetylmuramoyl-L-alanyl-D-glutamate--2,6-diaminopimelate ligase
MSSLSQLLDVLPGARRLGEGDPEIRGIAYDSRRVSPGDLFACLPGTRTDGRRFLSDAVTRGAAAVLLEPNGEADSAGFQPGVTPVPALLVPSAREAMARAAAALRGYPSRQLTLVGVTGTNGKTTTTHLVEALFRATGRRTGIIGTLGARIGDEWLPGDRTTPEAPDLQALFATMVERGVTAAAMEVSSHALAQHRTLGAEFDAAIFTNLTQDHLDYHGDMDAYFAAKEILFRDYPQRTEKPFAAVINADDPFGRRLAQSLREDQKREGVRPIRVLTYGTEAADADVRATNIRALASGVQFNLHLPPASGSNCQLSTVNCQLQLGGHFNVMNALAAAATGWVLGIPVETIVPALASVKGVPGRFESVAEGQPFSVIVDYAHSPDGLENVLRAARALNPRRLLVVFGCGGDRDRTKRPLMGAIAAKLADTVFVTSDNPRSEDPNAIIRDILAGMPDAAIEVEPDRRAAIEAAIRAAEPGDLVLIAGKGHEDYQIFADRTIHFDDREVARAALGTWRLAIGPEPSEPSAKRQVSSAGPEGGTP